MLPQDHSCPRAGSDVILKWLLDQQERQKIPQSIELSASARERNSVADGRKEELRVCVGGG